MALPTMIGKAESGFAYMALLLVISASLVALTVALPDLQQQAQRDKEAQFFFAGLQYQQAIKRFYENKSVSVQRYPKTLEELLVDNRSLKPQYHLRTLYPDPMTADGQWGVVRNENKEITGVYSLSLEPVIKTNFSAEGIVVGQMQGLMRYYDIKFTYLPNLLQPAPKQ